MVRGTTPTITLTVGDSSIDLEAAEDVFVTFAKGAVITPQSEIITKTGNALTVSGNTVEVTLTEEESLSITEGVVYIQVNWTYSGGIRAATVVTATNIGRQLLLEEITT